MPVFLIVGLEYRGTLSLSVGFQDHDIQAEKVRGFLEGSWSRYRSSGRMPHGRKSVPLPAHA